MTAKTALALALAFGVGGEPPAPVVRVIPAQHPVAIPIRQGEATHTHRCPHCGEIWRHGTSSHGSVHAHTCPRCGRVLPYPWFQFSR